MGVTGFQALSHERLRGMFRDGFGHAVSKGALMNMFIRSHAPFSIEAEKAKGALRAARVVANDEIGVRIKGTNSVTTQVGGRARPVDS